MTPRARLVLCLPLMAVVIGLNPAEKLGNWMARWWIGIKEGDDRI